jgi:hypothetical protein
MHVVNVGWKALPVGSSHHRHLSRLWRLNFLGNQRDSLHPPLRCTTATSLYFFGTLGMRHVPIVICPTRFYFSE